jgi:hypothetical protein
MLVECESDLDSKSQQAGPAKQVKTEKAKSKRPLETTSRSQADNRNSLKAD